MNLFKKILVMALLGAIGAVMGGLGGEVLFKIDTRPGEPPPRYICLLFDISGSMSTAVNTTANGQVITQLRALQQAAGEFVERQDLSRDAMGLVVFSTGVMVLNGLIHDNETLLKSIRGLHARGRTDMGLGLDVTVDLLRHVPGERWILLFSDGKPESSSTYQDPIQSALSAAKRAKEADIQIVAIGTGLADADLLGRITGTRERVIISDSNALTGAFRRSEKVIKNRSMLARTPDAVSFAASLIRVCAWASLIAIGAALGLVVAQNRSMRRKWVTFKQATLFLFSGVITGLFAGAAGQSLFYVLSGLGEGGGGWLEYIPRHITVGRVVAWALLGYGIGFGMAYFVPNLSRIRSTLGGLAGGILAGLAFETIVPTVGDTPGRLMAAAILGLSTGMTIVLIEHAYRKAWLIVHWGGGERSTVLLGPRPILIGHSSEAHIRPPVVKQKVPVMATITLKEGVIVMKDRISGAVRNLEDGETLSFGTLEVEVRAAGLESVMDQVRQDLAPTREPVGAGRR